MKEAEILFQKYQLDWEIIFTSNTLDRILDIKKGDVYNKSLLIKNQFQPKGLILVNLYMDDGYLFSRVTPVEVAVVSDSIDVK